MSFHAGLDHKLEIACDGLPLTPGPVVPRSSSRWRYSRSSLRRSRITSDTASGQDVGADALAGTRKKLADTFIGDRRFATQTESYTSRDKLVSQQIVGQLYD